MRVSIAALLVGLIVWHAATAQPQAQLIADGERALRAGETERATALFEQAATIAHAAEAELGLVRTSMQRGDYRRALALAVSMLAHARERRPQDALLAAAEAAIKAPPLTLSAPTQTADHFGP